VKSRVAMPKKTRDSVLDFCHFLKKGTSETRCKAMNFSCPGL